MSALVWGVKASLLGYVRGMGDGRVETSGGATESAEGFVFPGEGTSFTGSVTLTGHGGMLRIVISAPALVDTRDGWTLQIADPDDRAGRLGFATVATFDGTTGSGVALTADGAELFFGPYEQGTPLDDLSVGTNRGAGLIGSAGKPSVGSAKETTS